MVESFLMTNMAPQRPKLNQQTWRLLEQAVNELVRATGGSATVVTGGLFLDADGKPLPADAVEWIGRSGQKTVAVPTHFFKIVLLTPAEGPTVALAYVVPNQKDLPMTNPAMAALLRRCRTSVDRVEALSGMNLYPALGEAGDQGTLEASPQAAVRFGHPELYKAAALLWPQVQATRGVTTTAVRDRRFPAFIPSLWDRPR
jgi:endonuclease G